MFKVDCQCHVFPREYLKIMEQANAEIIPERDPKTGGLFLFDRKANQRINPVPDKFFDINARLQDLDRYGIDIQVLSIPIPGVDRFSPDLAVKLSEAANNGMAEFVDKMRERAVGLACLPLVDVDSALDEFDRAIGDLGLKGVGVFSNVNGKFIDANEFLPIYEKAQKYNVPIFVHPNVPVVGNVLGPEYALPLIFGWPFDTTIAMARIALSGILDRCPKLKLIFAHGGGMIPFFNKRLDLVAKEYSETLIKKKLEKLPTEYLKSMFVDTAVYYGPSVMCSIAFFGIDHVVFATDYPFGPDGGRGFLEQSVQAIDSLRLTNEEKSKVFSANAQALLKQ
jgi:predicted TIM-barrel fold metal-dependent hydrolase